MDPTVLAEAGGWAVVVAIIIGFALATARGLWVPRFVYDREVRRADLNAEILTKNTAAITELVTAVRDLRRA